MTDLVTTISDERLAEIDELVSKLNHLVSLDRPENGGPYQGLAARECLSAMQQAADAIQSLRAQGGVRVKPLEWTRGWMNAEAQTEIGQYIITYRRDGSFEWGIGILKGWASSWDEAKSAAQADYERRILSSLEASPAPVSEDILRRIHDALEMSIPHALEFDAESGGYYDTDLSQELRVLADALAAKVGQ